MTKPRWPNKVPSGASPQNVSDILGSVASETFTLLTNGLTVADNMSAKIVKVLCKHNTESLIDLGGKDKLRPAWFQPLYTQKSLTDPTAALPVLGTPAPLNLSRPDGRIGVTLQFAPPPDKVRLTRSTNQTGVANNTNTTVAFDTVGFSVGRFVNAAGLITTPAAGELQITYGISAVANGVAAGDLWGGSILNTTAGPRAASCRFGVSTQAPPRVVATGQLSVSIDDIVVVQAVQVNAAAAAKDIITSNSGTFAELSYISPPADYEACVVGIFWGG